MPPSLTEQLDNLYTTTWELRKAEVHDNIFTATPFWFWMKEKGKLKSQTGHRFVEEPLEYAKNESVAWLQRGDSVSLNDYEFLTESKWDWKYVAANITRFGVDDLQNTGKAAIMKLMMKKMDNTQNSLIDDLETQLFNSQQSKSIYGLQDLVADDPTSGTLAGIDTATYDWFRNQLKDMNTISFGASGTKEMRSLLNRCRNNRRQDSPDIIVSGQTPYEYYEDEVLEQKQIVNKKLGDAGFENIQFKGLPMIWSPSCANTRMYFLNTNFLYFTYDTNANFNMTEWKPIPGQVNDRVAQILLGCTFAVTRRLCQGVMHTIDTA